MGDGISAFGTTLSWEAHDIAELTGITGPGLKLDMLDVSSHDSASGFRERVAGMGDAGGVKLDGNFYAGDVNGQAALINALINKSQGTVLITFPDGATFSAEAFVTAFEPTAPFDNKLSFTCTLNLTGEVTWGASFADDLTDLTFTVASLFPDLAASVYDYTVTTAGTSVTCTPTCAGADSIEVWREGVLISTLNSGETSAAISAGALGDNYDLEVIVKEAGKSDRIYHVTLVKTA